MKTENLGERRKRKLNKGLARRLNQDLRDNSPQTVHEFNEGNFDALSDLYFAVLSSEGTGFIGSFNGSDSARGLATRPGRVKALCWHDGVLYDAGDYEGIHKTLSSGKFLEDFLVTPKPEDPNPPINALLSYKGFLIYAHGDKIRETGDGERDRYLCWRRETVHTLCTAYDVVKEQIFCDAGDYEGYYHDDVDSEGFFKSDDEHPLLVEGIGPMRHIVNHGGIIYFSDGARISNKLETIERETTALTSHKGLLIGAKGNEIFNALTGEQLLLYKRGYEITALCSGKKDEE